MFGRRIGCSKLGGRCCRKLVGEFEIQETTKEDVQNGFSDEVLVDDENDTKVFEDIHVDRDHAEDDEDWKTYMQDDEKIVENEKFAKNIAQACRQHVKWLGMWGSVKALARAYEYLMGHMVFIHVALLASFPFVSEFQTRLLFNQALSKGLQIRRILAGGMKNKRFPRIVGTGKNKLVCHKEDSEFFQ